eukprot:6863590-Pyramimonas_sp.AAC.2
MCTWIPLHRAVRAGSGNAARGTRRGGGGGRFASFRHARRDGAVQQVCVARLQHLQMTKSDLPRRNLPAVTLTIITQCLARWVPGRRVACALAVVGT